MGTLKNPVDFWCAKNAAAFLSMSRFAANIAKRSLARRCKSMIINFIENMEVF